MRIIFLLLAIIFFSSMAFGQKNGIVKGVVLDTSLQRPVSYATISLLEKKDSSLVSFSMTDDNGRFEFKGIRNGEYRLMITSAGYHNSNKFISISDADRLADLGKIVMNSRSKTLDEVIVQSEAPPVTMINDTVQYNAGSFKTIPNANVEQLLKKLPGIKVEQDGSIKAQGERVNKVLVDGKEFFGNDPKVATKNLPADAVDKVQVYDRQSDQAQLTGFDDGNSEKTINLKLKKDKKKGVFGKVNAGGGTNERFEGKFNLNSFKGARQMSALAMANNTNAEGFSFMDILNFTGELSRIQRGGGGDNININMSDNETSSYGIGNRRNPGIKTIWGGGINYNNIIGTKVDLQSNYFYNHYSPEIENHIQRQYFLPDSSYYYNQNSFTDNLSNNHRVNLNALYQIDSFNSIRIIPSFSYQKMNNRTSSDYQTLSKNKAITNEGYSDNRLNNEGYNFRNDIIYRKKLKRPGRTFSLTLQTSLNQSKGKGSLSSLNSFYGPDQSLLLRDTIDQRSNVSADLGAYTARTVYTEPLFKRSLLEFSVGNSKTRNTSQKTTYDFNTVNGKHDHLNQQLTNDFENNYDYTNAGIRMRVKRKKYTYSFGAAWQQASLDGKIIAGTKDSVISTKFTDLLPNARFQYNFSRFKSLSFNYTATTNQPTISQLQPVPDNSDPLNIREGNPDLEQEYVHTARVNLNLVNPYKNRNIFFFLNVQATKNKIVNYDSVNNLGIKYTKPVNINNTLNISSDVSYSMPVKFLKATVEISSFMNYNTGKQFINTAPNNIRSLTLGPELRFDVSPHTKINISLSASLNYNSSKYSLQEDLDTKYNSQVYATSFDWEMPKRFFFSTEFYYTINSQRTAGYNNKIPLWNAGISKQMLKFNRGELKLAATDLLNKNIGINRNSNQNYIEDNRIKTLRRFFLLSFTYSLSKTGLNNTGGGMRMMMR